MSHMAVLSTKYAKISDSTVQTLKDSLLNYQKPFQIYLIIYTGNQASRLRLIDEKDAITWLIPLLFESPFLQQSRFFQFVEKDFAIMVSVTVFFTVTANYYKIFVCGPEVFLEFIVVWVAFVKFRGIGEVFVIYYAAGDVWEILNCYYIIC